MHQKDPLDYRHAPPATGPADDFDPADDSQMSGCSVCQQPCTSDEVAEFRVSERYQRFSQKNDIFCRSFWDPQVHSKKTEKFFESYRRPLEEWRNVDGYSQQDFALRNAAWHVADFFAERLEAQGRREGFLDYLTAHREGPKERSEVAAPGEMARQIKKAARLFGADRVGITYYDERWVYTHRYGRGDAGDDSETGEVPMDLPVGLTSAIVVCHEMDHDLLRTVPSALSGTATGVGYSKDVVTLLALAQFIRNLGYQAIASMNDTAASIPLAIQAGLGEYGRHGLLIAPGLGPRLRIGKIFTDLPLAHDQPIRFGVREFCNICRKCSDQCPPSAIDAGEPAETVHNRSNVPGIVKWTTDAEKCFGFWAAQVTDCSICVRVCPYNRDYPPWLDRLRVYLMGTFLRRFMLRLDGWLQGGERRKPRWWWQRTSD